MKPKNARLMAMALLREQGQKVSASAGYIGLCRRLGLIVHSHDKSGARRKLGDYFSAPRLEVSRKRSKPKVDFYASDEWRALRYQALLRATGKCECCGAGKANGAVLHVDHIKPRSKYPALELVLENLQVLCEACNLGKSNRDETDWR